MYIRFYVMMRVLRWWTWPCDDGHTVINLALWWWSYGYGIEFEMMVLRWWTWPCDVGYFCNTPLNILILVPHALKYRRLVHYIHKLHLWVIVVANGLWYWFVMLLLPSLLFYAPLTHMNVLSYPFCFLCYSLRIWWRYSGRAWRALDVTYVGGWCS